jgi:cell division protein FtsB
MRDRPSRPGRPKRQSRPATPASPSAVRPGRGRSSSGPAGAAARTSAPQPPGRFTARAVVLGVVLLALVLSYVIPVQVYLSQRAEIAELEASQAAQRQHVADLETQATRWRDPAFIRIQARQRLYFGEPGEILLVTVWPDPDPQPPAGDGSGAAPAPPGPWWDTLWTSVESANDPTPGG